MPDKPGMSNTMNAVRFPLEAAEARRFRFPALSGTVDQLADAPAFDGLVTGSDRQCDFGHDSHDYPPLGAAVPVRRFPLRLAQQIVLWSGIDR